MKPNPYFFCFPCSSALLNFVQGMFWALETPELPCSSAVSCPGKAAEQGQMMMYRSPGERARDELQLEELKMGTCPCWELSKVFCWNKAAVYFALLGDSLSPCGRCRGDTGRGWWPTRATVTSALGKLSSCLFMQRALDLALGTYRSACFLSRHQILFFFKGKIAAKQLLKLRASA